jgi:hypothetical protein
VQHFALRRRSSAARSAFIKKRRPWSRRIFPGRYLPVPVR